MSHAEALMDATFAALEHREQKWYADFWTVERAWVIEHKGRCAVIVTREGKRLLAHESELHDSREAAECAHWNALLEARAKFGMEET